MRHETLSVMVSEISAEMLKAKEAREDFELPQHPGWQGA
jgi:hypothetical protein